jgi:hypothetical protein
MVPQNNDINTTSDDDDSQSQSPTQIRNKYTSNRRGSLAADFGDDDDNMQDELDRLTVAQIELQKELLGAIRLVDVIQAVGEEEEEEEEEEDEQQHWAAKFETGVVSSPALAPTLASTLAPSSMSTSTTSNTPTDLIVIEEGEFIPNKSFAKGFFKIIKPKETLESQKKRQLEIVQENLKSLEPGLEDVMHCQLQTQESMVWKKKQMEELKANNRKKLPKFLQRKPRTLQEDTQRQLEILRLTVDSDLADAMGCQHDAQKFIVQQKQHQLNETKEMVENKLKELDLEEEDKPQFWSNPRKRLEAMMGIKEKEQIEPSVRDLNVN